MLVQYEECDFPIRVLRKIALCAPNLLAKLKTIDTRKKLFGTYFKTCTE